VPTYPAGITVSNHALITVSDALRHRRAIAGTRWRRLSAGEQALLVLAHLRLRRAARSTTRHGARCANTASSTPCVQPGCE
jgi:hypothetical protein